MPRFDLGHTRKTVDPFSVMKPTRSIAPVACPGGASQGMSIGAFAKATGIPAETLRSWERRYGQPVPMRLPSGHRRYRTEDVARIRLVASLIEDGRRPSELLRASLNELTSAVPEPAPLDPTVTRWMRLAADFRSESLHKELTAARGTLAPVPFLSQRIRPLLHQLGEASNSGRWDAAQEGCAREVLGQVLHDLMTDVRAKRASDSPARVVVVGLPGEEDGLALQMLQVVAMEAGAETWSLSTNCPTHSIARAVAKIRATHVLTHVSAANAGIQVDQSLRRLLGAVQPQRPEIIAGGPGAIRNRRGVRGVTYINDLVGLHGRLAAWRDEAAPQAKPQAKPQAGTEPHCPSSPS